MFPFLKKKNYQTFIVVVQPLIFDDKRQILLAHRSDKDMWNLPGGKLENGETPWEGLKREVQEEIGISISVDTLEGIYSRPQKNMIILTFHCSVTFGVPTTTRESNQVGYFPLDRIPKNISYRQVERIKDAVANFHVPVLKIQQ